MAWRKGLKKKKKLLSLTPSCSSIASNDSGLDSKEISKCEACIRTCNKKYPNTTTLNNTNLVSVRGHAATSSLLNPQTAVTSRVASSNPNPFLWNSHEFATYAIKKGLVNFAQSEPIQELIFNCYNCRRRRKRRRLKRQQQQTHVTDPTSWSIDSRFIWNNINVVSTTKPNMIL